MDHLTANNPVPCVWIGSLHAYNCGRLIGEWVDATDLEELNEAAARVLRNGGGEEIALMDYEGFGDMIGEYTSLDRVAEIASAIAEHGEPLILFARHIGFDAGDDLAHLIEWFQEAYIGSGFDSLREYAEDAFADLLGLPPRVAEQVAPYIDYDRFQHELEISGHWIDSGHVFSS